MQIPFHLDILRLWRGPLQSLSSFYKVVKKLYHFEPEFFCRFDQQLTPWVRILSKKTG